MEAAGPGTPQRAVTRRLPRGSAFVNAQVVNRPVSASDLLSLTKPRLSSLVLCTCAGGVWLAPGGLTPGRWLLTLLGTAGTVGAANALNCYVERDVDRAMMRTRNRPLPAGRMEPVVALRFALALAAVSLPLLALGSNLLTTGLGLLALLTYVFVYGKHLIAVLRRLNQRRHSGIDMRAIRRRFGDAGAGNKPALRPCLARAGGDIIGVEQKREALIEWAIIGRERTQQKLLEKPGDVRAMPFRRACLGHRLHDLVFGGQWRRAAFGLGAHGAKRLKPEQPRVARLCQRGTVGG